MSTSNEKSKQFPDPRSHERTRRDHSSEKAEDYVEAVDAILSGKEECRVVDLAAFFGVSHVTVTRIVSRLVGEGLLETDPVDCQGKAVGGAVPQTAPDRPGLSTGDRRRCSNCSA